MPDGLLLPLLLMTEAGIMLFCCAAGVWTLRRWLRCRLWQPGRFSQELLFALFVLFFGGQMLYLIFWVVEGASPWDFAQGAGLVHKAKLALFLLLGQGSALLCFVWLCAVLLLVVCYGFWGERMRQWCAFGQMARRVAAVTTGLLPLAGVALLFDHAARMHWKFDLYGGSPGTSVGISVIALFAAYVVANLCIVSTAAKVYEDRQLRGLAVLPLLVFVLFLACFVRGVFYPVFR